MAKIFVIVGDDKEAIKWIKEDSCRRHQGATSTTLFDYIICRDVSNVKGYRNPHGVFVGTWRDRPDIKDIIMTLLMATDEKNDNLQKVWADSIKRFIPPIVGNSSNK